MSAPDAKPHLRYKQLEAEQLLPEYRDSPSSVSFHCRRVGHVSLSMGTCSIPLHCTTRTSTCRKHPQPCSELGTQKWHAVQAEYHLLLDWLTDPASPHRPNLLLDCVSHMIQVQIMEMMDCTRKQALPMMNSHAALCAGLRHNASAA